MKVVLKTGQVYTEAEVQGLQWLGEQAKWLKVSVQRKSEREFDLKIEGEYDADDGYDYGYSTPADAQRAKQSMLDGNSTAKTGPICMKRTYRGFAKVKPQKFSAWLPLACLRVWWSYGLHYPLYGDWSFSRDMLERSQWAEFDRCLGVARSRPVFSQHFMQALNGTWQSIAEEGVRFEDNEDAIETCLDANRLDDEKAEAELDWLDERFGPQRVVAELAGLVAFVTNPSRRRRR